MVADNSAADPLAALLAASRPHVLAACRRKRGLFAAYPDLTREDLVSHVHAGLIEAVQRGQGPRPGKLSTWVGMVAGRRLLDLAKVRARTLARERSAGEAAARDGAGAAPPDAPLAAPPELATRTDEPLEEWAERVYEWARARWSVAGAAGGKGLSVPQRTALLAVQRRQRASTRGMVMLLAGRPGLRRVLGLARCPSRQTIARLVSPAKESVSRKKRQTDESAGRRRITHQNAEPGECLRVAARLDRLRSAMRYGAAAGYRVTPEAAAEFLGLDPETLARWRRERKHLPFRRYSERLIFYRQADLDAFAEQSTVMPAGMAGATAGDERNGEAL